MGLDADIPEGDDLSTTFVHYCDYLRSSAFGFACFAQQREARPLGKSLLSTIHYGLVKRHVIDV